MERLKLNIQYFADGKVTIETEIDVNGIKVGIKQIQQEAEQLGSSTSRVGDIVKGNLMSSAIQKGFGMMVSGFQSVKGVVDDLVVSGGMDRALNIEQAQFKLKGLGHEGEELDEIMKNALASVKGTAYGLDSAATVAASAVAAGIQPGQELERTLSLVADAAAITGRDMDSMGAIFNKVAASGKMTGQELNQLTDAGIPMLDLLSKSLGKTTAEVRDMVSEGKIGFAEFQNAIEIGMGGAAKKLGETFSGNLENVKAAAARLGADFMGDFTKSLTPALGNIINIIDAIASGSMEEVDKNIDELGDNVEKAITGLIENLGPILERALTVIEKLLPKLIEVIENVLPTLMPVVMNVITTLIKIFLDNLPAILNLGIQVIVQLALGIAKALPDLIPVIVDTVILLVETLIDNIDLLVDAGIELILGLAEGLIKALPRLIEKIPEIIMKLIDALVENLPKLIEMGITLIVKLAEGLIKAIPQLISKIPQIIGALVNGFITYYSKLFSMGKELLSKVKDGLVNGIASVLEIGKQIVQGVWNGISNSLQWIKNKLTGWIGNVVDFIKRMFGIHSPSTVMRDEVGKYLAQGLGVGFDDELDNVYDDMQKAIDLETSKMSANVQSSGTYQAAMMGTPTFNLLDNTENTTQLVVNGKLLAEVVNTENRNREVATA